MMTHIRDAGIVSFGTRIYRRMKYGDEISLRPADACYEMPDTFAGITVYNVFMLQDVTDNERNHFYPKDKSDESVAIRKAFHEKYGPYTRENYVVTTWKQIRKFGQPNDLSYQKEFFRSMGALYAIILKIIISFEMVMELDETSILVQYAKTFDHEHNLKYHPKFECTERFPNQAKTDRTIAHMLEIMSIFRDVVEAQFHKTPSFAYKLSPKAFRQFMERDGTYDDILYGVRLSRKGWLNEQLGEIIAPMHQAYWKETWSKFLPRFLPFPMEICGLISEYLIHEIRGESFSSYFERIYDVEMRQIKTEFADLYKLTINTMTIDVANSSYEQTFAVGIMPVTI